MSRSETIPDTFSSKGVALELYLENSRSLSKTFGYEYYEELPSQITRYLTELAEGNICRYTDVEFVVTLEQFSEGQASNPADEVLERFRNV